MDEISLVIMAAGMGSRFGGLKQAAQIDGRGHRIIDYSVYDAVRAGFRRIVFIIRRENEEIFRNIANTYKEKYGVSVDLVFQDTAGLPVGSVCPEGRKKPWGTAHAVACLVGVVSSPFALINADDFYGRAAFFAIYDFLFSSVAKNTYAMVGYRLENTLSKNGSVSRGICKISDGFVEEICEMREIKRTEEGIFSGGRNGGIALSADAVVSVNMWGFLPSIISECQNRFSAFLTDNLESDPLGCEFYLPTVVSELVRENKVKVKLLKSTDKWLGVTYREDIPELQRALRLYVQNNLYPEKI